MIGTDRVYVAADIMLLLASDSARRNAVIEFMHSQARSSSYVTSSASILTVCRAFLLHGAAPESFLQFISPLIETVLPVEERDILDALRLCSSVEMGLDLATEASIARYRGLSILSTVESFDRVPGLRCIGP